MKFHMKFWYIRGAVPLIEYKPNDVNHREIHLNRRKPREKMGGTHPFNMAFREKDIILDQIYDKQICSDFYYKDF